jgi:uracil phosphoribosyltransferase
MVIEEALSEVPYTEKTITTDTEGTYEGLTFGAQICGVSIMRAGDCMVNALSQACDVTARYMLHAACDCVQQKCRTGVCLLPRSKVVLAGRGS